MKPRTFRSVLSVELSNTIRVLRLQNGLSLEAISRQAGISRAMWQQVETGKSSPTVAILEKIAHALGQHPGNLLMTCTSPQSGVPDQPNGSASRG